MRRNIGPSLAGQMGLGLACLAALCLALAGLGLLLLQEAQTRLEKGYLASEIHGTLVAVAHDKAQLRVWAYRALLRETDGARLPEIAAERLGLLSDMSHALSRIEALDGQARALQRGHAPPDPEEGTRATMIAALTLALEGLARETAPLLVQAEAVQAARMPGAAPQPGAAQGGQEQALARLERDLDTAEGGDLPELMSRALAAEAEALLRERARAETAMARARTASIGAAALAVPGALGLSLWLGIGLRRPLARLQAGLAAYAAGTPGHRLGTFHHREFDRLARQFDSMADEIDRHRAREASAREALEAEVARRTADLEQALRALAASDRARTQLLADVSHGLRTPVTVIRGESQIALRRPDDHAGLRDGLARIVAVTRQMERLIEDLLVLVQIPGTDLPADTGESGQQPGGPPGLSLQLARLDLAEALGPALALAQGHGLERDVQVCAQIPPGLSLSADPVRLRQVMGCLLENAVRYSHHGGQVMLRAAPCPEADHPMIRLEIVDQGIGIAPEEMGHVLGRGWRSKAARAHRPDGLGLGLAIAQALAQAQGAALSLHPNPEGMGIVARLDWPAAETREGA